MFWIRAGFWLLSRLERLIFATPKKYEACVKRRFSHFKFGVVDVNKRFILRTDETNIVLKEENGALRNIPKQAIKISQKQTQSPKKDYNCLQKPVFSPQNYF